MHAKMRSGGKLIWKMGFYWPKRISKEVQKVKKLKVIWKQEFWESDFWKQWEEQGMRHTGFKMMHGRVAMQAMQEWGLRVQSRLHC